CQVPGRGNLRSLHAVVTIPRGYDSTGHWWTVANTILGGAAMVVLTDDLMRKGTTTVSGAVREYGVGRSRLYELMADGVLVYSQFGARRLIPRVALERLITENLIGVGDAEK